jgi:hypothetical protein
MHLVAINCVGSIVNRWFVTISAVNPWFADVTTPGDVISVAVYLVAFNQR